MEQLVRFICSRWLIGFSVQWIKKCIADSYFLELTDIPQEFHVNKAEEKHCSIQSFYPTCTIGCNSDNTQSARTIPQGLRHSTFIHA